MEVLKHVTCGTAGKPLRIIQITDTHLFPEGVTSFKNEDTTVDMKKSGYSNKTAKEYLALLIKQVRPDVAILTGDIIDGRPFGEHKRTDWLRTIEEFIDPLVDAGIYWSFTPGNHDDDGAPYSRKDLLDIYSLPYCLSKGANTFDHTITVGPSEKEGVRLWLFDSGENSPDKNIRYTSFSLASVAAHKLISKKLRERKEKLPGLAFFHIPLPQYMYNHPISGTLGLFDAARNKGQVPRFARYFPWLVKLFGADRVAGSSMLDSGLFESFSREGNVKATFCGHDHYNDAVMWRDGVYLCYGRVCSYTPPIDWEGKGGPLPFEFGARIVEVRPDASVATWVQSKDGIEPKSYVPLEHRDRAPAGLCARILCSNVTLKVVNFIAILVILVYVLMFPQYRSAEELEEEAKIEAGLL
uniref:Calcineurin-like phosphoesterase domain-containing protein n=2 Tax=Lotharella globosa TaxID=91324 RepID=A0A7S3ZHZ3_9EUKA